MSCVVWLRLPLGCWEAECLWETEPRPYRVGIFLVRGHIYGGWAQNTCTGDFLVSHNQKESFTVIIYTYQRTVGATTGDSLLSSAHASALTRRPECRQEGLRPHASRGRMRSRRDLAFKHVFVFERVFQRVGVAIHAGFTHHSRSQSGRTRPLGSGHISHSAAGTTRPPGQRKNHMWGKNGVV